jgi:hypothetical protein
MPAKAGEDALEWLTAKGVKVLYATYTPALDNDYDLVIKATG